MAIRFELSAKSFGARACATFRCSGDQDVSRFCTTSSKPAPVASGRRVTGWHDLPVRAISAGRKRYRIYRNQRRPQTVSSGTVMFQPPGRFHPIALSALISRCRFPAACHRSSGSVQQANDLLFVVRLWNQAGVDGCNFAVATDDERHGQSLHIAV